MRKLRRPLPFLALLGVAATLGIAAGCGDDDDSADVITEIAPGDVDAGKVVFAENCTSCHLGDGTEDGGAGPNLSGKGSDHTAEQLRAAVVNGREGMPAGIVSGEELDNVVAYMTSLK